MEKFYGAQRAMVIDYAKRKYGTQAEYLWSRFPRYAVLRDDASRKWYGVIMDIPAQKLGMERDGKVDVLEIKTDPLLGGSLLMTDGILPAYHMKKGAWLTVLLDGSVDDEQVCRLLDISRRLTVKGASHSRHTGSKSWIVPANPAYYDIEKAVSSGGTFIWKQSSNIASGDTVYIYVAAPVSAVSYKCRAVETDIPYEYSSENVNIKKVMRLECTEKYDKTPISFRILREFGINSVRGPRYMPHELETYIQKLYDK